eukprot:g1659.t1
MPGNPVKVVVRTRPTANFANDQLMLDEDKNTITVNTHSPEQDAHPTDGPHNEKTLFKFAYHQVLHNASQEATYHTMCSDVVLGACDGIHGTIMAYGQTGAGKTFTMIGDTRNYQHRGIAPRAIGQVFAEVQSRFETEYRVTVSYMEIYNERMFDLLDGGEGQHEEYQVVQDVRGGRGVVVRGMTEREVSTEREALDALFEGELQRTTAQHSLNRRSNRSHCVFTLHLAQRSRTGVSEKILHSKLHLVDLAGSERLKKTMADPVTGDQLDDVTKKESMAINRSLSYLEQCVVALSKRQAGGHVPYRSSTLTHVLMDSLGGNCRTLLFACIWGEAGQLEETVSTLRLAQRMMRVTNEASVNYEIDPRQQVKKLERDVRELKQELKLHDALAGRSGVYYDEYAPEAQARMAKSARKYVDAAEGTEDEELQVESMREVRELFKQMKKLVRDAESSMQRVREDLVSRGSAAAAATLGGKLGATATDGDDAEAVGDLEPGHGFGVGRAPDGARPPTQEMGPQSPTRSQASPMRSAADRSTSFRDRLGETSAPPMDRNEAFEVFKTGPGRKTHEQLHEVKGRLKQARLRVKAATESVNDIKFEIDSVQSQLEQKQRQRRAEQAGEDFGDEDVVDEEEFRLMKQERDTKRAYRTSYADLRGCKQEADQLRATASTLQAELVGDFEKWHATANMDEVAAETMADTVHADKMDDGEIFDQMEMDRVVADDPDSLAFFQAHKKMKETAGLNKSVLMRKQHNKRHS